MSSVRTAGIVLVTGLAAVFSAGCQESGDDGIRVDATGAVAGLAWIDRNGNGTLEGTDGPAADIRVELRGPHGGPALYTAETDAAGEFLVPDVLVGDYRASVDGATVGDSLRVLRVDSAAVTVVPEDTAVLLVALSYPVLTTDSARLAPAEARLFVEGRILVEWGTYGDPSIHVRDSTGAIRAVRVQPTGTERGDSVRLLGAATVQAGQPVLKDAVVFLISTGVGESPPPVDVSTADAATAGAGALDADLVRVTGAVIQDTVRNALGEPVLRVDDGSGVVDVVFDRDIPLFVNVPAGEEVIGLLLDATGILMPASTEPDGRWVIKPRDNADLTARSP